jgi:hypothetical protein
MRAIAIITLLAVSGCAPTVSQIGQQCGSDTKPFVEYWPCQKPRLAAEIRARDDIKAEYLAKGDLMAERVKAGKMTDAEAKMEMANAYREAVAATQQYSVRVAPVQH